MSTAPGTAVAVAQEGIDSQPVVPATPAVVADIAPEVEDLAAAVLAAEEEADRTRKAGVTTAPVVESPAAPATPAAGQPVTMVPLAALAKERTARQQLEKTNAQLEGAYHALKSVVDGRTSVAVANQAPEPTVEERLATLAKQRLDDAKLFDENKLTAVQLEEKRQALEAEERKLRDQNKPAPAAAVVQQTDDLALAQHSAQLVKDHPVLRLTSVDQLLPLQDLVYRQAEAAGETPPVGVMETTWLRERVAKLAEQFYPNLAEQAKALTVTAVPIATPATPAAPAPLSATAVARDAKLNLAAAHPADVSKLGSPASVVGQSDAEVEARLNAATEDEAIAILASMPALQAKLLGRTS